VLALRPREKYQHLLPQPHVLADRLLVYVRLQRLIPRLVLFRSNRLQSHEHANMVDNGRLTVPR
jgi:hypothetical protein